MEIHVIEPDRLLHRATSSGASKARIELQVLLTSPGTVSKNGHVSKPGYGVHNLTIAGGCWRRNFEFGTIHEAYSQANGQTELSSVCNRDRLSSF